MKLYFVRHGESIFNQQNIHQHAEVPLSKTGVQQAERVSHRFKKINVDVILTSHMKRAIQTAEIIQKVVKKDIVKTGLLQELKRPTEIEGKSIFAQEVVDIKNKILKNNDDPLYHYSDEENFFDLKNRIENALSLINARTESNIVVVTHAVVIRMFLALIIFEKIITPQQFYTMEHKLSMTNTGLTLCEKKETEEWRVLTINDHTHLG